MRFQQKETSEVQWRRRLCASARDHLCRYADEWLRPRQRDEHNAIRCVAQDEHENAFLEHHRHAETLVMYLLDYYGKSGVDRSRGVRVIVLSRFDNEDINPEDFAIEISMTQSVAIPPLEMFFTIQPASKRQGTTMIQFSQLIGVSVHD